MLDNPGMAEYRRDNPEEYEREFEKMVTDKSMRRVFLVSELKKIACGDTDANCNEAFRAWLAQHAAELIPDAPEDWTEYSYLFGAMPYGVSGIPGQ